jgi:hypothetical protein
MLKPRTHFEQIPLAAVRKIVEGQAPRALATRLEQATVKKKLKEDPLAAQEQSPANSRASSQVEISK